MQFNKADRRISNDVVVHRNRMLFSTGLFWLPAAVIELDQSVVCGCSNKYHADSRVFTGGPYIPLLLCSFHYLFSSPPLRVS